METLKETEFQFAKKFICDMDWHRSFFSGGFLSSSKLFQRVMPFIMLRLILFFVVSQTLRRILKPLKQGEYVCNLMAGIILGPSVLGMNKNYAALKNTGLESLIQNSTSCIGILYYIFIITVKIDTRMLIKLGKKVQVIGISSFFAPFIVMIFLHIVMRPMNFTNPVYLYSLAVQLAASSFINLAPLFEELNLLTTELGQLALSTSLINDILVFGFFLCMILARSFTKSIIKNVLPFTLVITFTLYVLRPIMQWIIKKTPEGQPVKEFYVLTILLTVGLMGAVCDLIWGSAVLGVAFLGLVVPNGPPLGSAIVEKSELFVKNCLLPFFFMAVGDMTNIYDITNWKAHFAYQLIIIVGVGVKALATTLPTMAYNMNIRQAISLGLITNSSGVVQSCGFWMFWLSQTLSMRATTHLVLSSLMVTIVVVPISLYFYNQPRNSDDSIKGFELSIQAASMGSKMRVLACVYNEDEVPGIVTFLRASNPTESNPISIYVVHLTELRGQVAPVLTPHRSHKRICKHNGCIRVMTALQGFVNTLEGKVTLQLLTLIAPFKSMHEGVCRLAQDKMIPLMIVPFNYKNHNLYRQQSTSSDLNRKIQTQAPCTVGIFVDRGLANKSRNQGYFSLNILVIFFGGEDDREVLTYVARMLRHSEVNVTILRIVVQACHNMSEEDRVLDKFLLDSIKTMIIDDERTVFKEVGVEGWLQAVQVVQSLDNNYDLVMVGRRHGETNLQEQEMSILSESPELGHIGEMLVSTELKWENVSILIMQHCVEFDRDALGNLMSIEGEI